jgi:hypothetical protein
MDTLHKGDNDDDDDGDDDDDNNNNNNNNNLYLKERLWSIDGFREYDTTISAGHIYLLEEGCTVKLVSYGSVQKMGFY